ncbi:DUF6701 domain-containing protein [Photobacterium phosphoreum]|uniref:DUF6701 domain-containing protein n=1 Tax=Photobacterium phosphoreum TaxID=659 RepID=UPI001E59B070|nr:DUF6701 domain-containing protein [Photobacterium phosphoreum]MCD9511297.1 hypothetical protein [Photobacterium phosphoreum]
MKFVIIIGSYLFLLLVSFNAIAEPVFDFGQYQVTKESGCIENDCEIILEKSFTRKPLVFLMPTITNNGLDAPSTLKVTAIYKKTAEKYAFKVRQIYPVISDKIELEDGDEFELNKDFELYKIPMMKIAYFAMEEGEIALGHKGRILAGKKEIRHNLEGGIKSLYKNQKLQKNSAEQLVKSGKLISIPLPPQFKSPGAMAEIQPTTTAAIPTDDDVEINWFTPLMIRNNNHSNNNFGDFYLGVDSSETGAVLHKKVTVAYLLVEGSGFHRGLQFALGSAETPNTLKDDYSGNALITQPVLEQCKGFTTLNNTNFDFSEQSQNPILFMASKNSRFGSNGGWVRLCQVETDAAAQRLKVSFVNDEDLNENNQPERAHANEEVGFMAFQRRVAEEVCDVFPGPVQTWQDSNGKFEGSHKLNITGAALINSKRYIGFETVKNTNGSNSHVNDFCEGKSCQPIGENKNLYAEKLKLDLWPQVDDGNLSKQRDFGDKKIFWFNTINLSNKNIVFPSGSVVHVKKMTLNNSSLSSESKKADDLLIFVHDLKPSQDILHEWVDLNAGTQVTALIYSERNLFLSNGNNTKITRVTGAVTAPNLIMTGDVNYIQTEIIGQSACFEAQPEYQLAITPTVATSTLCELQKIEFLVSQVGASKSDFEGDISFSISSSTGGKWARNVELNNATSFGVGTSTFVLKNSDSRSVIWLQPNGAETVTVTASIADMAGDKPVGEYSFIPGGFSVTPNNNNIIAGQPFSVTVKAVACANQPNLNDAVITQYSGVKQLEFDTRYLAPSQGQYHVGAVRGGDELSSLKVNFTNGISDAIRMRYRDAGSVNLVVKDQTCTSEHCDLITMKTNLLKRADLPQGLVGEASIQSRPWTFAICPQAGDSFRGTANSGNGLAAAGDAFVVRARPLQWQTGDKVNNSIDVSDDKYCQRPITPNFLAQDAPVATVTASVVGIDTPQNGHSGELSGITRQQNSDLHDNTAMIFDDLRWSEVGSVKLAMTADSYLGMKINPSQRAIGRFYPKQFVIKDSAIINAHTESSPFTYMDQTFTANAIIEAQNAVGEPTRNYGAFAPRLKERLLLTAVDLNSNTRLNDVSTRIDQSNLVVGWQHDWQQAQLTINDGALTFKRLPKNNNNSAVTITTADGPFKVGLGLSVLPRSECLVSGCTDFANKTQPLQRYNQSQVLTAPLNGWVDSRYGRMVLDDASGVFDQPLTMPLKVEYWNGDQFTINTDDSRSHFNSQWSCKQIIYTSKPHAKASLSATTNNVLQGKNYSLQVLPGIDENEAYIKQQLRFWLRIAAQPATNIGCTENENVNQPWLTFNWRGIGDEDPSGLVTFGNYRGNDRIIYRSENASINP